MNLRRWIPSALLLLGALLPVAAMAQSLTVTLNVPDGSGISVGGSITLTVVVNNSTGVQLAGTNKIKIPNEFTPQGSPSCVSGTWNASPPAGYIELDWTQPDVGGGFVQPGNFEQCSVTLKLQSLPGGTATATTTESPGGSTQSHNFNINYPASFSTPLAAAVSGQNVTVTFAAQHANSCTAMSTPSVPGWSGTVCSSVGACGSVSKLLSNLSPGPYQFDVTCNGAGGNASSPSANATVAAPPVAFTKPLNATVDQQSVVLTFGASYASSCTGSSMPSVSGWSGTVCNSVSACTNFVKQLTSVPAGTYTFSATCTGNGTKSSTAPAVTVAASVTNVDVGVGLDFATSSAPPFKPGQSVALNLTVNALSGDVDPTGIVAVAMLDPVLGSVSNTCQAAVAPPTQTTHSTTVTWNVGSLARGP